MSDLNFLSKQPDPPRRKLYQKPAIEKINLVPNEAVLGSICVTDPYDPTYPDCEIVPGTPSYT